MGYNISDVSGNATGGVDQWYFTGDLRNPGVTVVRGNFNVVDQNSGQNQGEATNGYTFGPLSTNAYGTLSFNTTNGTFTFTINRAAVLASGSNQTVSFTITGRSGLNTDDDRVHINLLICVCRGTLIDTPDGPRRVETLSPGDMVTTLDEGAQPVRWIGSRRVGAEEMSADPSLRPIVIRSGALGGDLPWRDLRVSPQHCVLQSGWQAQLYYGEDEVLAPARSLVDGRGVTVDEEAEEAEYFHLLLDRHQILLTEGAPTESFLPGAWSLGMLSARSRLELLRQFPHLFDDPAAYGPAARPVVRRREGVMLRAAPQAGRPAPAPRPAPAQAPAPRQAA